MSASDRLFGRVISLVTVLLALVGIWFCFLAFSFVRWMVWAMLFHWMPIAAVLMTVVVLYLWRSWGRD